MEITIPALKVKELCPEAIEELGEQEEYYLNYNLADPESFIGGCPSENINLVIAVRLSNVSLYSNGLPENAAVYRRDDLRKKFRDIICDSMK